MPICRDEFDPIAVAVDWLDAGKLGDLDGLLDLYDEGAIFECDCEGVSLTGRQALSAYWAPKLESLAAAAFPSGRPINGDPGGSAGAAAGAAAGGADAGGCWENAGAANRTPAIVPASKMERPAVTRGIIEFLPKQEALDSRGPCENGPGARPLQAKSPPLAARLQSETGKSA